MQSTMIVFKSSYGWQGVSHIHKQKQPHKIRLGEAGHGESHLLVQYLES